MLRRALIIVLCLAIAALGVSGAHVHVPDAAHEQDHGAEVHGHAFETAVLDHDHDADHADHGAIDVDPVHKAFGKAPLILAAIVLTVLYVLAEQLSGSAGTLVLQQRPTRPPKRRFRFVLLPPSHAPPCAALPR